MGTDKDQTRPWARPSVPTSALPEYVRRALAGFEVVYDAAGQRPAAVARTDFGRRRILVEPRYWDGADDLARSAILTHEVTHWLMGYPLLLSRLAAADPNVSGHALNLASDAVIHHHLPHIPAHIPEAVTFRVLGLEPMGVMPTYYALLERHAATGSFARDGSDGTSSPRGCGSCAGTAGPDDLVPLAEALARAASAPDCPRDLAGHGGAGKARGWGRAVEQADPPAWVRVLPRLLRGRALWRPKQVVWRESASVPDLYGVGAERAGRDLDLLIDVSASISDQDVATAVAATREAPLRRVRVVVFSDRAVVIERPATAAAVQAAVRSIGGGGTVYRVPAGVRRPGVPAVWVTDGRPSDGWPPEHPGGDWWVLVGGHTEPPATAGRVLWRAQ